MKLIFQLFVIIQIIIIYSLPTFAQSDFQFTPIKNGDVVTADFNNDTYIDVLIVGESEYGAHLELMKNNGDETFTEQLNSGLPVLNNSSVDAGYFNNDAYIDIAITGSNIVKIYTNNGDFTFKEQLSISSKSAENLALWGDYDNDNYDDLLIVNDSESGLYHNSGTGSLDKISIDIIDVFNNCAAWGDYDNDGNLDFAVSGQKSLGGDLKIYKNTGTNFNEINPTNITYYRNGSMEWGDFNQDGYLDLLVTGISNASWETDCFYYDNVTKTFFAYNNSNIDNVAYSDAKFGNFFGNKKAFIVSGHNQTEGFTKICQLDNINNLVTYSDNFYGVEQSAIGVFDCNNDGYDDFILSGEGDLGIITKLYVYNSSTGNYEESIIKLDGNLKTFNQIENIAGGICEWVDFNNDNLPDLLIAGLDNSENPIFAVYQNIGNSLFKTIYFEDLNKATSTENKNIKATAIDYDNDNYQDIMITFTDGKTDTQPDARFYKNINGKTFQYQASVTGIPEIDAYNIECADLDGDNYPDIAITGQLETSPVSGITKIYENNNGASFSVSRSFTFSYNHDFSWADYHKDGDPDFVFIGDHLQAALYINNVGILNKDNWYLDYLRNGDVKWFDCNNDSYLDIIITGESSPSKSRIYIQRPGNGFELFVEFDYGITNGEIACADYDKDGYTDILYTGDRSGVISSFILKNNGDGTFTEQNQIDIIDLAFSSVDWVDVNNDTYPDIVITGADVAEFAYIDDAGKYTKIYVNDQNGNFSPAGLAPEVLDKQSIVFADYNKDSHYDLFQSGKKTEGNYKTYLYKNNDLGYAKTNINLPNFSEAYLSSADYNNDGYVDLIITGSQDNIPTTKVLKNGGNETFSHTGIFVRGVLDANIDWADYNNDGYNDFIICGTDNSSNRITKIYKNTKDEDFEETNINLPASVKAVWNDFNNDNLFDLLLFTEDAKLILYKNNGNADFENIFEKQFPKENNFKDFEFTDINNDGYPDIIMVYITGYNSFKIDCIYYINNQASGFNDAQYLLNQKMIDKDSKSSFKIFDFNNDGYKDFVINEQIANKQELAKIFYGNSGGFTTDYKVFPGTTGELLYFTDFDNDTDLDIYISGEDTANIYQQNTNQKASNILINQTNITNNKPSAPTNLQFSCSADTVFISWDKPADDKTPKNSLTYNCYMYEIGGDTLWHSMSNHGTGKRYILQEGNVGHNTSWFISGLKVDKEYAWSVQAIDNSYAGSEFAQEITFRLAPEFTLQPENKEICEKSDVVLRVITTARESIKWQMDKNDGKDFIDITPDENFKNINTADLSILNAQNSMNGYKFRCLASNIGGTTISDTITLTVYDYYEADPGVDTIFCSTNFIANANMPENSTGKWTCTNSDVQIFDANSNITTISNLPAGETILTWTITQSNVCGENSESMKLFRDVTAAKVLKPSGNTECVSGTLEYWTKETSDARNYAWKLTPEEAGNMISTENYATISWNDDFYGDVELKAAGVNACTDTVWSDALQITMPEIPAKATTPEGETSICKGTTNTNYTTTGATNAITYIWSLFPETAGSITGTGTTATVLWNTAYSGNATIKVKGVSCKSGDWSEELSVSIYESSPEKLSIPSGDAALCVNPLNTVYTTQINNFTSSYIWEISDGGTLSESTSNSVEVDWTDDFSGEAKLKVRGENACGLGDWSDEYSINIDAIPVSPQTPQGETGICMNGITSYIINSVAFADNYTWQVTPNIAGTIEGTSANITTNWQNNYKGEAQIRVKAVNQCGGSDWSDALNITINSPTVSSIQQKGNFILYIKDAGYKYQWYRDNEKITGATKQFLYNEELPSGNYQVKITDENNCSALSETISITTAKNIVLAKTIKIYPNPAIDIFNIEMDNDYIGYIKILIKDESGKIIQSKKINKNNYLIKYKCNINQANNGIYFIEMIFNQNRVMKNIFINQ